MLSLDFSDASSALSFIQPHDRDTWVRMAMAVKSEFGDAGFDIWDDWSRGADSYKSSDARAVWRSVGDAGGVTVATLIHEARAAGWVPSKPFAEPDPEQVAKIQAERKAAQAFADAEKKRKNDEAAEQARMIWDAAAECTAHPYLKRKGVAAFGLRVGRWTKTSRDTGEIWLDVPDALLVPIRDGKKIVSLQAIFATTPKPGMRDKDYLSSGKKSGCMHTIGAPSGEQPVILICEGYATGASLHMATGYPVVVTFDAQNLPTVAVKIRKKYPTATLVIAADNDQWTAGNPGVKAARSASSQARAWLAVPEFDNLSDEPTDFNDLHQARGLDAVSSQVEAVLSQRDVPASDECVEIDDGFIVDDHLGPASLSPEPQPIPSHPLVEVLPPDDCDDPGVPVIAAVKSIDYYSALPMCNSRGTPKQTIENLREILRRLSVTVRYNVIKKETEILIPGASFSIDNEANASLAWLLSQCAQFDYPTEKVGDFLCYLGDQNQYNPVAEWIHSRPWDGVSRLPSLYSTIKAVGEEDSEQVGTLKQALMMRWLISACAAVFNPTGVSAHGVLVFQGAQYLGKTAWFKSLAPKDLGVIQDGLILRPDDRDSVKKIVSNWLVELGELDATFRRSDIAQLKAFLPLEKDTLRRPYARLESSYARRTVFFASVNPQEFLHDPTGNRRYWTIQCEAINHQHGIDMQQLWREVHDTLYRAGESWFLTPDEMALLNAHNEGFEVCDPITERIQSMYDWEEMPSVWRWMTATDAMAEMGFDKPSIADVTRCAIQIRKINGGLSKRTNTARLLKMPSLKRF